MGNIIMVLIFAGIGFSAWATWHKYEKEKLEVLERKCIEDAVRLSEVVIQQQREIEGLQDRIKDYEQAYVRRGVLLDLNGIEEKGA